MKLKKGANRPVAPFCLRAKKLPAVTPATPVSSTSTIAPFLRPGLVDDQGAPIQLGAVERLDRLLSFAAGAHLHKAEAP